MAPPREETPEHPARRTAQRGVLAVTFLFVLVAVSVSAGLVVYTAWLHELKNGAFAIVIALLSARAALSWCLWHRSSSAWQQDLESRKPADEVLL